MRLIVWSLAGLAGLAACAPLPPAIPVSRAQAALVGRPAAAASACMGLAPVQRSQGSVTLWSYPSPTATSAAPVALGDPATANFQYTPFDGNPLAGGFGESEGPAAPSGCIVNLTLDGGTVRAVTYVGPNGRLLRQDRECSELVRDCVR